MFKNFKNFLIYISIFITSLPPPYVFSLFHFSSPFFLLLPLHLFLFLSSFPFFYRVIFFLPSSLPPFQSALPSLIAFYCLLFYFFFLFHAKRVFPLPPRHAPLFSTSTPPPPPLLLLFHAKRVFPLPPRHAPLFSSFTLSSVICHLSSVICHLSSVSYICHLSSFTCHLSSFICHMSFVVYHLSTVITYKTLLHATRPTLYCTFLKFFTQNPNFVYPIIS